MYHNPRTTPRNEYLQQESLRVQASPSIAEKFPRLKSITVDLAAYNEAGLSRSSQIKYTVNVSHAKSVFRIFCHNPECVRGDFDLSDALAEAVSAQRTTVDNELCCRGWRSRAEIDAVRCGKILRYTLTLHY